MAIKARRRGSISHLRQLDRISKKDSEFTKELENLDVKKQTSKGNTEDKDSSKFVDGIGGSSGGSSGQTGENLHSQNQLEELAKEQLKKRQKEHDNENPIALLSSLEKKVAELSKKTKTFYIQTDIRFKVDVEENKMTITKIKNKNED